MSRRLNSYTVEIVLTTYVHSAYARPCITPIPTPNFHLKFMNCNPVFSLLFAVNLCNIKIRRDMTSIVIIMFVELMRECGLVTGDVGR